MSTYTDLRNKIRESLNVDYATRVTTQNVKFFNEQNEYWGSFSGTIKGEDITIQGGNISHVTISNAYIVDSQLKAPDGEIINVSQLATNVNEMSNDVKVLLPEADARLQNDVNYLSTAILSSNETVIADLSSIFTDIDDLSAKNNALCIALSTEIINRHEEIVNTATILSNYINSEKIDRIDSDNKLHNELVNLLSTERFVRSTIDRELSVKINDTANTLSNELLTTIARDKHFEINEINNTVFPYVTHDYSVNTLFNEVYPESYFKHPDLTYSIAKMELCQYDSETHELSSFNLKIFETINFEIKKTLSTSYKFDLDKDGNKTIDTGVNNYQITYSRANNTFSVSPKNNGYYYDCMNGTLSAAKLHNAVIETIDDTKDLVSGILEFKPNTILSNFTAKSYDIINRVLDEVIVSNDISSQIYYDADENVIKLSDDIRNVHYKELSNTITHTEYKDTICHIYEDKLLWDTESEEIVSCEIEFLNNDDFGGTYSLYRDSTIPYYDIKAVSNPERAYKILFKDNKIRVVSSSIDLEYRYKVVTDFAEQDFVEYVLIPGKYNTALSEIESYDTLKIIINSTNSTTQFINGEYTLNKREDKDENVTFFVATLDKTIITEGNQKTVNVSIQYKGETITVTVTDTNNRSIHKYTAEIDAKQHTYETVEVTTCTKFFESNDVITTINYVNEVNQLIFTKYIVFESVEPQYNDYTLTYDLSKQCDDTFRILYTLTENATSETQCPPLKPITYVKIPPKSEIPVINGKPASSRTFIFSGKFSTTSDEPQAIYLKFIDDTINNIDNKPEFYYINNKIDFAVVQTNKYFVLKFTEIKENVFAVEDLMYTEFDFKLDALRDKLSNETEARIQADEAHTSYLSALSTHVILTDKILSANINNLSDEVYYLSNEISTNNIDINVLSNDVAEIYTRIKSGLNYKGSVIIHDHTTHTHTTTDTWEKVLKTNSWISSQAENVMLSTGYMFLIKGCESNSTGSYIIENIEIENNDYIIINDNVYLTDVTSAQIDVIDAVDNDDVEYISSVIDSISTDLSNKIDKLELSAHGISTIINSISTDLSNKIDILELSTHEISTYTTQLTISVDQISTFANELCNSVVHLSGNQTIVGGKTFTTTISAYAIKCDELTIGNTDLHDAPVINFDFSENCTNLSIINDTPVYMYENLNAEQNGKIVLHTRGANIDLMTHDKWLTASVVANINTDSVIQYTVDNIESRFNDKSVVSKKYVDTISIDIQERHNTEIIDLSTTVDIRRNNIIEELSTTVDAKHDADAEYLSALLSSEMLHNIDAAHIRNDLSIDQNNHVFSTILSATENNKIDKIKHGYIYRVPQLFGIADTNKTEDEQIMFEENDFLIFKRDVNINDARLSDIYVIHDYLERIVELCADINYLSSASMSLSTNLSTDINLLSTRLSTDINTLSTSLSTDINSLSTRLSTDINSLSTRLSTDIDTLSINLSTDLSNTLLSVDELSTYTYNLALSVTELSGHYHKTFEEHNLTGGTDTSVDNLVLVDEDNTSNSYYLTYKYGTMVLVKRN